MYQKNVLAKNLKKYVKKSGKSARTICKDLNIPYYKYQEWISVNSVRMPHVETLASLADYFGIRSADFFVDDDTSSPLDKQNKRLLKSIRQMEQKAIRTKKAKQKGWILILMLFIIMTVIVYLYLHKGG